jgi:hypothetical protein
VDRVSAPAVGANVERYCALCDDVTVHEFDGASWCCTGAHDSPKVVPLDQFVAVEEPGAEALVGRGDDALFAVGSDGMLYGDGGAGKTTLGIDLAFHAAAGEDWIGFPISHPLRVLLIESEGPRPLFRKKLRRKRAAWPGSPPADRLHVWQEPWGRFTFADESMRQLLAEKIAALRLDLVIVGPLVAVGMDTAGTLQEVLAFARLVDDVRARAECAVAFLLVHHESKGGKVSGAWEGRGDTLLHVQPAGPGQTRLYVQKARWASSYHRQTLRLRWGDGESFALEDEPSSRPERTWDDIAAYVLAHGGCSWNEVDDAVTGQAAYKRSRRAQMLADGLLINTGTNGFALWHRDDPVRLSLETGTSEQGRTSDAPALDTGDGGGTGASVRPPYKGTHEGRTHLSDASPGTDAGVSDEVHT